MTESKSLRMMKTFIDNPWDAVQQQIEQVAEDELLDDNDPFNPPPSAAEQEWAKKLATRIASRVMMHLDGGDYPADRHGLRCSATEGTDDA